MCCLMLGAPVAAGKCFRFQRFTVSMSRACHCSGDPHASLSIPSQAAKERGEGAESRRLRCGGRRGDSLPCSSSSMPTLCPCCCHAFVSACCRRCRCCCSAHAPSLPLALVLRSYSDKTATSASVSVQEDGSRKGHWCPLPLAPRFTNRPRTRELQFGIRLSRKTDPGRDTGAPSH